MLPGILAIEGNQHCVIRRVAVAAPELRKLVDEVVGCIVAVPGRIAEADEIRQRVVAEKAAQRRLRQPVRLVVGKRIFSGLR